MSPSPAPIIPAGLLLALAGALAGCVGPLGPRGRDYGDRLPPERFRRIEPAAALLRPLPARPLDPAPVAAARFANLERVEVSLEEARASTLERNLGLRVALVDPAIANQSLSAEEAAFEAAFTTRASWTRTDSPTASELQDAQAEFQTLEPGVTIPLLSGGSARVALPIARSETNNPFSTLNPAYTTDLRFSLSQPLLRGAGRRAATYGIRVASYNRQIAEARTTLSIIQELVAVEIAYWRLYQFRQELEVARQQFDLAQALLERAERLVRAGRAADVEVLRAQAGAAERLEAIIIAQNNVLAQQREFKRIANFPGLDLGGDTLVVPATPPDPVEYEFETADLVHSALAARMELLQTELALARDATTIDLRENQALPNLDVSGSYTINGLGGSLSDSLDVLQRNRFEDWSVGLDFVLPLGNEAARANLRSAILARLQRISTRAGQEQTVRQEVLNAADNLRAGWQRILAARQAVLLNARTLEAEQRQFEQGLTTSTEVLDASTRLAGAQFAEIRAVVDYQIAQVRLAQATGTVLGAARVAWEPAPAPDLAGPFFAPRAPRVND